MVMYIVILVKRLPDRQNKIILIGIFEAISKKLVSYTIEVKQCIRLGDLCILV